ncbi:MAG: hypothetical protein ABI670_17595 [Chloroflexota bacterium]
MHSYSAQMPNYCHRTCSGLWYLASRGFTSGYPCGGPGESYDANNLPYFRSENNATRGQTSKIVSIAVLPDCSPLAK